MRLNIPNHQFNHLSADLEKKLNLMAEHVLSDQKEDILNINLKFVSSFEMKKLNKEFRNKSSDTNVLSFPASKQIQEISGELGDIAMSIPYIKTESQNLNRDVEDHMMHLLAHGILHLLGFDHKQDKDACIMESQEIKYLKNFKIANPYKL